MEILKSIHHPNIVKLLDVYNSETCVYLVMELVTGGHLQARLKDKGCYDEAQAKLLLAQVRYLVITPSCCSLQVRRRVRAEGPGRSRATPHLHSRATAPAPPLPPHRSLLSSGRRWGAQVIAAVHYLHNINVIHRDIKPENLLFVETGDELNVKPADV